MRYKQTTQVPNEVFDQHLSKITFAELKLLLIIIRQTYGWKTNKGKRKQRDRITYSQFQAKTGLSRRVITQTVQTLLVKHLITVTAKNGDLLHSPDDRKGRTCIYYAPLFTTCADNSRKVCTYRQNGMHNRVHNKTNTSKLKETKGVLGKQSDKERIMEILGIQ